MIESGSGFTPLAASTGQPPCLAMQRLWLSGEVAPFGARLSVEHQFQSAEEKALEVSYSFALPRDAALRQFRIRGNGWEVTSDLRPTAEARKVYEAGIRQGSLAAMAQQFGDGVVNLAVGNLQPGELVTVHLELLAGVELHDGSFRFRFPFTLAPVYHRQAKALIRPDGAGEMRLPRDIFGDVMLPPVHRDGSALHGVGFDLTIAPGSASGQIGSPSHTIQTAASEGGLRVSLGKDRDVPDRDLVLDVREASAEVRVFAGRGADGKDQFAVIAPSTAFGGNPNSARRVVILLDRSGSMSGDPIAQARRAIDACLGALTQDDSFGLVAFDDRAETFRNTLCAATRENREDARRFLKGIDARGGTELSGGIEEAARLLASGGDVVVLTDGQVGATESILAIARGAGVRLHCLGIGSASQDRFLTLLARETGGVSRFVTPEERVDLAAVDLFASIGRPVASDLKVEGRRAVVGLPSSVYSGTPVLFFGEVSGEAEHAIELSWNGGSMAIAIPAGRCNPETLRLVRGSRLITDWESRYPSADSAADERQRTRVAELLIDLGREYGLANREMSLVAVVKRAADRPGELPEIRVVPVGMPRGTSFDAYFQMGAASPARFAAMPCPPPPCAPVTCSMAPSGSVSGQASSFGWLRRMRSPVQSEEDKLITLAAKIEPDGGMPGRTEASRVSETIAALREFVRQGHTATSGAFRSHVARLIAYLEKCSLTERQQKEVERLVA